MSVLGVCVCACVRAKSKVLDAFVRFVLLVSSLHSTQVPFLRVADQW